MGRVYGLKSTRRSEIRYVGKTAGDSDRRFLNHLNCSHSSPEIGAWVRRELWLGFGIYEVTLFENEQSHNANDELRHWESYWIKRLPRLLNDRLNPGTVMLSTEDHRHIRKVAAEFRPACVDNWNGCVGLRRYPPDDDGVPYELWAMRVFDAFGTQWSRSANIVISREEAIERRRQDRNRADRNHQRELGFTLPWPEDCQASPRNSAPVIGVSHVD